MLIGAILAAAAARAEPSFGVERGLYDEAFELSIEGSVDGATVYASTDGTTPTQRLDGPLRVDGTTVVRAFEELADGSRSATVTHTYIFPAEVLGSSVMEPRVMGVAAYRDAVDRSLRALPSMSLATGSDVGFDEVPVSWEWIDPAGEDLQIDCGARRVGGHSVGYAKNSIRLLFRERYGAKNLDLNLYGADYRGVAPVSEHDALTLRSGNHDSQFYLGAQGQHLRNFWMDETQLDQGHVAPHGRFTHLYIDGEYTGLYHLRERFNAAFMARYLGGSEEDYEAVNGGYAFDGSGAAWNALLSWAGRFEEAQRWLDVPDFLDYMVLNYYAANAWDWSSNHNWIAAGPTRPDAGGFRFHSSDSDICLYYDVSTNILGLGGPSNVFASLTSEGDPDFRTAFVDAVWRNVRPGGALDPAVSGARYSMLAAMVDDAIVAESARWGGGWWDKDGEWVTERDRLLADFFPRRTEVLVEQFRAAGWYGMDGPTLDPAPGRVPPGTVVTAYAAGGEDVAIAAGGSDPRLPGGEIAPSAVVSPDHASIALVHSARVYARPRDGETWGPVDGGFYEIDEDAPLALNEWNAVDEGALAEAPDAALGSLPGNGGDWIELVILADLDLRGWTLVLEDAGGARGSIAFTQDRCWPSSAPGRS